MDISTSFKIGVANWLLIGFIILLFLSPLGQKPGAIHPLLIVPFFYFFLSFVPTLFGALIGFIEKYKNVEKRKINIGIYLNVVYLIIFFSFIAFMWEKWMSI